MAVFKWAVAFMTVAALTAGPTLLGERNAADPALPARLTEARESLARLPVEFGSWRRLSDSEPLSPTVCRELGLAGEVGRKYVNHATGDTVELLLMVGRTGRLVRHPPHICFATRGNEQIGGIQRIAPGDARPLSEFTLIEYRKHSAGSDQRFAVAYGFADQSGAWKSPSAPRLEYGGTPTLYKVQVLTTSTPRTAADARRRIEDFLNAFVPAFSEALPASGGLP